VLSPPRWRTEAEGLAEGEAEGLVEGLVEGLSEIVGLADGDGEDGFRVGGILGYGL